MPEITNTTKTLDELAMEYAIVRIGAAAYRSEGIAELRLKIPFEEWQASEMKHRMERVFDVYQVQEAIKRAEEIVRMVIPGDINDDA